ncbi:MAG TPA: CpsD/CapB family tyrosine-protein kinase [Blastocatellia bacterium]|jgi:capsular exopolysaccharide synthesis family protein|nr:CpsD/CapB family tyrosine-protein kinase [Blastocatellia bacterium]
MGRVYEALNKAEKERNSAGLSAVAAQSAQERVDAKRGEHSAQYDFMDYSLKALPAEEVAHINQEAAAAALARKSLIEPRREVDIDLARADQHLVTFFDKNPVATDQYNKLAISMISATVERRLKKVLIASAHHGEGRSTVTLNLACALSRARQRVLVVDTDLDRPSLLRLLGFDSEVGLADALKRNLPTGEALVRVLPFGFDVLATRERVENATELLTSASFREMISALEDEYDFILFDSSPLLRVADSGLLVRFADATVLVIRAGKTSSIQLGKAVASLTQENIFGVVLNRTAQ